MLQKCFEIKRVLYYSSRDMFIYKSITKYTFVIPQYKHHLQSMDPKLGMYI